MSTQTVEQAMLTLGENARQASRELMRAPGSAKTRALLAMADAIAARRRALREANRQDV